ncbi:MAG TPA: DUF4350 domain-containing protein [Gemmataceae bacterium]|nr:DUF4350 domain-containing protein [Gemmataceae bacterium]
MTRLLSWLLVLLLFGAFAGAVAYALWLRAAAGKGMPEYSVYSQEADGLAEAARFLRQSGWEPVALTRPIALTRYRGLLVLVEPSATSDDALPEGDAKALLHWVEAGNTLLYCGRHTTRLHAALGVTVITDETAAAIDPRPAEVGDAGRYTDEVNRITVEGKHYLESRRGLPSWWVDGRPGAVLLKRGKGRVVLVADSSLLTERGLRRADNAVFFYNVARRDARDGKVYFDEYHHGLHSGGGPWGYLAYHRAHWVLVPIVLLAGMAAWSLAVRLGPAVPRPQEARADAVDYASAVARIYERAGARRLPARALVRGFLAALTKHLHLRRNALPAEVLRAWQEQHPGESAQRLQALLRGVTALRKGDVNEQQLLEWSQAFDNFQREMIRAR